MMARIQQRPAVDEHPAYIETRAALTKHRAYTEVYAPYHEAQRALSSLQQELVQVRTDAIRLERRQGDLDQSLLALGQDAPRSETEPLLAEHEQLQGQVRQARDRGVTIRGEITQLERRIEELGPRVEQAWKTLGQVCHDTHQRPVAKIAALVPQMVDANAEEEAVAKALVDIFGGKAGGCIRRMPFLLHEIGSLGNRGPQLLGVYESTGAAGLWFREAREYGGYDV